MNLSTLRKRFYNAMRRSVAEVPGGFVKKSDKRRDYWYYQQKQPDGKVQQIFVGPDDERTRTLIARHSAAPAALGGTGLQKQARAAIALGCAEIPLKHGRVIGRLLDHGFFRADGLLVGTHAYLAYQNMFGVRWGTGAFTVDPDFAHAGKHISLAIAANITIDTAKAIDSLEMGLFRWDDVTHRGPGWKQRLKEGWAGLNANYPAQRFAERFECAGL